MNYSKKTDEMEKRIKEMKQEVEDFLNQGVIGTDSYKLQKTLESHERIKILLDDWEYFLDKDVPEEILLDKISNIRKEIRLIRKEFKR